MIIFLKPITIFILIQYFLRSIYTQSGCIDKCKTCDNIQCLECIEGFSIQPLTLKCVSICQFGKYYDYNTKQCVSICPYSYYNDNLLGSCEQLPQCPFLIDQGNQYFNTFSNYLVDKDKIFISGQDSSSTSPDYSLKLFDTQTFNKLGSLVGHQSEILSIRSFSAQQLQTAQTTLFEGDIQYSESLVSISTNEIIEWDQIYGNIKNYQAINGTYYIPTDKQMIYQDEKYIILNYNQTQFGLLDYRSLYNDNNQYNFDLYFTLYPVVHLNYIIGYYKTSSNVLFSYSQQSIIKWNTVDQSSNKICKFDDKIASVIVVSPQVQIITYSTTTIMNSVYRDQCSELDFGTADQILQINIVDPVNLIITTLTTKQLILYIIQEQDSISSVMYSSDLSSLTITKQVVFLNIYDQSDVMPNGQIITKKNVIIIYSDGLLRIYEIPFYVADQDIPRDQWFILKLEVNLSLSSPVITSVIVNKAQGNIILLGKELTFVLVNFPKNQLVSKTTRKNIAQQFSSHKGRVNGVVGDPDNNRVITYSDDGSFMIWEEFMDSFSGTTNARMILQQYYPYCNLGISQTCQFPLIKLILGRSNLIVTQYNNDNKIYTWNYLYDAVWLNRIFSLSDNTQSLVSMQFNKQMQKLTLANQKEIITFDVDTGLSFMRNTTSTTDKYFYGIYDYQNVYYRLNYQLYAVVKSPTTFAIQLFNRLATYNSTQTIVFSKGVLQKCDYIEATTSFFCFTNNALYIIESDYYLYTVSVLGISAVSYLSTSRAILVYQYNLKVTQFLWGYTSYASSRSFVFSSPIDQDSTTTTIAPDMYYFYQNTPVSTIKSQVFGMGVNIDVQQMISFDDKISSVYVNQYNQKIYIGFENGNVQSGYFSPYYNISNTASVGSPQFFFSNVNKAIYYYNLSSYSFNLFTNITTTMTKHKSVMTGLLLDQKYNFFLTYSGEDFNNLYMYNLLTNTFYKQVTNSSVNGTHQVFMDTSLDILISYSATLFDFQSWYYPNLTKYNNFTEHANIKKQYDNEQVDSDGNPLPNKINYTVIQNIFNQNNGTLISINNINGILIYDYVNMVSYYTVLDDIFMKVFLDDVNQRIYLTYSTTFIFWFTSFDSQFRQVYTQKNLHTKEIKQIIMIGTKLYSYDEANLFVFDRQSMQLQLTISCQNPKITSVIISQALNYVFIWNNNIVDKIQNSNIAIYSLIDASQVFVIQSTQQIENGNINNVVLDEDQQVLFFSKDANYYVFAFDLQRFLYSAYYLIAYDTNIIQMTLIPELNSLVILDASAIYLVRVENALNQGNNFKSLTSSQNTDLFQNNNNQMAYLIDRDNVAWSLNYTTFDYSYLFQFSQIKFTQQTNNNFYVTLNYTLIQFDLFCNKLNQIDGRYRRIWYGTNTIYAETVLNDLYIIDILTFKRANFTLKMPTYIKKLRLIEQNSEFLVLFINGIVSHYNYQTNTLLYQSAITDFLDIAVDTQNNAFIHVRNSSLEFYGNYKANMTSYMTVTKNRVIYNTTKEIRSIVIDSNYNRLYVIHKALPVISTFNYTFNQSTKLIITPVVLGYLSQPSRSPNVRLLLINSTLQIQTAWEIMQYQRSNSSLIKYWRDSRYLYSMFNYNQLDNPQSQFALISAQDGLLLLQKDPISNKYSIAQKFSLDYPTVISFDILQQPQSYKFTIKGLSNQKFFNYNFYLPIVSTSIQSSSPSHNNIKMNQCYIDLGSIQYYYNQDNLLSDLQRAITFLNLNLTRSLIYIAPTLSFYLTNQIASLKSQIVFQNSGQGLSPLVLEPNTFYDKQFSQLQIQDFQFDISQVNNLQFNSTTQRITLKDVQFTNSGTNFSLNFTSVAYVNLENIIIDSITLSNSSSFLTISYCNFVYLKNVTFNNIILQSESKLIEFIGNSYTLIESLTFNNIQIDQSSYPVSLLFFQNIMKLYFTGLKVSGVMNNNIWNTDIYFMKSRGNTDVQLNDTIYQDCVGIPFLSQLNSYELNQKIYYMSRDSLKISILMINNIQQLRNPAIDLKGFSFLIQNANVQQTDCLECQGSAIKVTSVKILQIDNSTFVNNTSTQGGAIAILTTSYDNVFITNSIFLYNTATASGGAIYLEDSDLELFNCTIMNNQATIGGGVRFIGIQPKFVFRLASDPSFIQNNTIQQNYAEIHSNNYGSYTYSLNIKSDLNISEVYSRILQDERNELEPINSSETNNFHENPLNKQERKLTKYANTVNQENVIRRYQVSNFQSGGNINFQFQIEDQEGQPIRFNLTKALQKEYHETIQQEIASFVIKAYVDSENIKIYGQYITDYLQFDDTLNVFNIKEMNIVSIPETVNDIYFEVPSIKRVSKSDTTLRNFDEGPFLIKMSVQLRKCIAGEIYKETSGLYLCQECKVGFYSLEQPSIDSSSQQCSRCPAECSYCYRNMMTLKEGYWKIDNSTDAIIYCANKPLNCDGEQSTGYCKQGHYGPLCESCDTFGEIWGERYMSDGKLNCVSCSQLQNDFKFLIPTFIVAILMILYMVFSIRIAIEISELIVIGYYLRRLNVLSISKSAYLDTTNMNMKAMMNYMQVAQMVNTFEVELPEFMKILPQYLGSPVNNFMFTFDCYLSNFASAQLPMVFLRTMWTLLLPFIYLFGMGLVYFILVQCKWARHNKNHLISGLVFLIFFLQPNMVQNLLGVMSCRRIDKKQYVLQDISNLCYTEVHIKYILFICIPAILVWAFILPLLIVRKLYVYRNRLDNALIRIPYGFLYQDYKPSYFYWEFIKVYMKIIIITIINFYGDPYNNKLVITMILFLIYLVFLQRSKPYQMLYFQNLDRKSIVVLTTIILMNIFLYNKPDIIQQQIFYIIVLAIHNFYLAYLIYQVAKAKLSIIYKMRINSFKQYLIKKFPILSKYLVVDEKSYFKIFALWKKAKKEIIETNSKRLGLIKSREKMNDDNFRSAILTPYVDSPIILSQADQNSKQCNYPNISSNRELLVQSQSKSVSQKQEYKQLFANEDTNKDLSSNRMECMNKNLLTSKDIVFSLNFDDLQNFNNKKKHYEDTFNLSNSGIYKNLSRIVPSTNPPTLLSENNLLSPSYNPISPRLPIDLEVSTSQLDEDEMDKQSQKLVIQHMNTNQLDLTHKNKEADEGEKVAIENNKNSLFIDGTKQCQNNHLKTFVNTQSTQVEFSNNNIFSSSLSQNKETQKENVKVFAPISIENSSIKSSDQILNFNTINSQSDQNPHLNLINSNSEKINEFNELNQQFSGSADEESNKIQEQLL